LGLTIQSTIPQTAAARTPRATWNDLLLITKPKQADCAYTERKRP
jgi:hypothetical protein